MLDYDVFQNEKGILITIFREDGVLFITYFDNRKYIIKPDCMRKCERWGIYYTSAKHCGDSYISQSEFDWYCHQQPTILNCCNGAIWEILKSYRKIENISYFYVPFNKLLYSDNKPGLIVHDIVRIILRGTNTYHKPFTLQAPVLDMEPSVSNLSSPSRIKQVNQSCANFSYDSPKRTVSKKNDRMIDYDCNTVGKGKKRKYVVTDCDFGKKIAPRLYIPNFHSTNFKARKLLF